MGNTRVELCLGNYFSSLKYKLPEWFPPLLIIKWSSQQVETANIKPEHNYGLVTETSDMSGKSILLSGL